jgi:hypothetical protein
MEAPVKTASWAIAALALTLAPVPGVTSAGAGWYLLVPPVTPIERKPATGPLPGPITWRYNADLRIWSQEGAFDSARECEAEKARRHDLVSQERLRRRLDATTGKAAEERANKAALDAYLGGRPAPKMTPEMERAELAAVRAEVLQANTDEMAWRLAVCIGTHDPRLR